MKKIVFLSLIVFTGFVAKAQLNPVTWTFTSKKLGDKLYQVEAKATIQNKWHLYSQTQPADAIADPTAFVFNANPLITLDGKVLELGKLEKYMDKSLGISANQYSNTVTFTQKVKLKAKVKTNLTGNVTYQTCDDQKCLPPKTVPFTVSLN
jgi:thiol:disulfide interchange protein DsbD